MWLMNMEEHEPPPATVPTNAGDSGCQETKFDPFKLSSVV